MTFCVASVAWEKIPTSERAAATSGTLLAAEYVRMLTEHQQYSTRNQAQTIRKYTKRRGIRIVKT